MLEFDHRYFGGGDCDDDYAACVFDLRSLPDEVKAEVKPFSPCPTSRFGKRDFHARDLPPALAFLPALPPASDCVSHHLVGLVLARFHGHVHSPYSRTLLHLHFHLFSALQPDLHGARADTHVRSEVLSVVAGACPLRLSTGDSSLVPATFWNVVTNANTPSE